MRRFERIPTVVEAVQWTGENLADVLSFGCTVTTTSATAASRPPELRLLTGKDGAQGMVPVPVGHWVVRDATDGHFYPIDPDVFESIYREVHESDGDA